MNDVEELLIDTASVKVMYDDKKLNKIEIMLPNVKMVDLGLVTKQQQIEINKLIECYTNGEKYIDWSMVGIDDIVDADKAYVKYLERVKDSFFIKMKPGTHVVKAEFNKYNAVFHLDGNKMNELHAEWEKEIATELEKNHMLHRLESVIINRINKQIEINSSKEKIEIDGKNKTNENNLKVVEIDSVEIKKEEKEIDIIEKEKEIEKKTSSITIGNSLKSVSNNDGIILDDKNACKNVFDQIKTEHLENESLRVDEIDSVEIKKEEREVDIINKEKEIEKKISSTTISNSLKSNNGLPDIGGAKSLLEYPKQQQQQNIIEQGCSVVNSASVGDSCVEVDGYGGSNSSNLLDNGSINSGDLYLTNHTSVVLSIGFFGDSYLTSNLKTASGGTANNLRIYVYVQLTVSDVDGSDIIIFLFQTNGSLIHDEVYLKIVDKEKCDDFG